MSRHAAGSDAYTYLPDQSQEQLIQRFAEVLDGIEGRADQGEARLMGNGESVAIPEALFPVLRQVVDALAQGMAVTVAPLNAMLTTQEAADYLGVSRPTFVRILERGELAYEKPGRHRYVRLVDLMEFQRQERITRRAALDEMVRAGEEAGLYDLLDGPPPRTR